MNKEQNRVGSGAGHRSRAGLGGFSYEPGAENRLLMGKEWSSLLPWVIPCNLERTDPSCLISGAVPSVLGN